MKAVRIETFGGSENLLLHDIEWHCPSGMVEVESAWAGVNYVDIYQREGRYPGVTVPFVPGIEGSGRVRSAPSGSGWRPGDRVAYTTGVQGSYAERVAVPADHLVAVPDAMTLKHAAAVIEQGLTAAVLMDDVAHVPAGADVLVHAAAGGVGGLLTQMLLQRGCRVFGCASSAEKANWLSSIGAIPVLSNSATPWAPMVRESTAGAGVAYVFDSVGKDTFDDSLQILTLRGHLVLFGAASGAVAPVDPLRLMRKSLTLTRPVMPHYVSGATALRQRADALFAAIGAGHLQLRIHGCYRLEDAAIAHETLAARSTQGKLLLTINADL